MPLSSAGKKEGQFRLARLISQRGGISRRAALAKIKSGHVTLNGKTADNPLAPVREGKDFVRVKGLKLKKQGGAKPLYFAFHKPEKILTTAKDPKGRATVMDFFKKIRQRVFPVGRLDYHSEGLLILTNDGDFAGKAAHPRTGAAKTYLVKAKGQIRPLEIAKLTKGVTTPFGKKKALFASQVKGPKGKRKGTNSFYVRIIISEGKKRQIRLMMQQIGHPVLKLKRTAMGRLSLGSLKKGTYKALRKEEAQKAFLKPKELRRKRG